MLAIHLNKTSHLFKSLLLNPKSGPYLFSFCKNLTNSPTSEQFSFTISKFNDVHIKRENIVSFTEQTHKNNERFENVLKNSIEKWESEKRSSIWLYFPINLSSLIEISAKYGFKFHHAENDQAVLCKWLPKDRESKIPLFASHQVGVAGVVYRADTDQLLLIKDRVMIKDFWKLPGGAANLGENIQDTAVREVFEETGIKTKFASVISFRQQHNYPTAHGRSDLYVICRLEPLSFEINACQDEIKMCEWINLDTMIDYTENQLTKRIAKLIKYGKLNGFDKIDICSNRMDSPFAGRFYNLFHRNVNLD